ncbi:MAG: DUF5060 domain-containing protein [Bacteroidales bacterium]|nr:DUF5060 domain-containing protein [Bacteroidales bacterium]MCF8391709.1 DUF5060 domain-containing protein [Bacteroidales bacterium]
MKTKIIALLIPLFLFNACKPKNEIIITGEMQTWHKITIQIPGPDVSENSYPNPFLNYRLEAIFSLGDNSFTVPGYFAADGNAAESGAVSGNVWKIHFSPNKPGDWSYKIVFREGENIAVSHDSDAGKSLSFDGYSGRFTVSESDKVGKDFRSNGRIIYDGGHYLRFEGSGKAFLKGGADSPENFLGYRDFDGTSYGGNAKQRQGEDAPNQGLHAYSSHVHDWNDGDPVWREGRGKGMIGALNYLASKGMNSVYFLTLNILGDGDDVWPYTDRNERYRFDCSKLDQWEIVFSHMDELGLMLHVVLQETENELLLDAGYLDVQRKLYLRELVARFSHHLGITWNLGEEHGPIDWSPYGQTAEDTKKMAAYLKDINPYNSFIVVHSHSWDPPRNNYISQFIGDESINGLSLQEANPVNSFGQTIKWLKLSEESSQNWVVSIDEIGQHWKGALPDSFDPLHDTIREHVLWANLMAGGGGVEWYFGYRYPHADLNCEDWRSRDILWDQTRYALEFFNNYLPFDEMKNRNELVDKGFCFAKEGEIYALYVPEKEKAKLELRGVEGKFEIKWYNPRLGGELLDGSESVCEAGKMVHPGIPPSESDKDWICLLQKI